MADDVSGVVVIGLIGTAIGVFVVDYAFSAKGASWFDQIKGSLGGGSGADEGIEDPPPAAPPSSLKQGGGILPHVQPSSLTVPVTPPSPALIREVQARLNSMSLPSVPGVAHLPLKMDGLLGPDTQGFLVAMQTKWRLPTTAYPDSATIAMLRKMTASKVASKSPSKKGGAAGKGAAALAGDFEEIFAGAPALAPAWTAEIQKLGDHSANVISHAIASEVDAKTLKSLGSNLSAAGYPLASAAVLAKLSAGSGVATSGWFPAPWWG